MATPKPKSSLRDEASAEYQKQLSSSRKAYKNVESKYPASTSKAFYADMAQKGTSKTLGKKYPYGGLDLGGTIKSVKDTYMAPGENTDTNRKSSQRRSEQAKSAALKAVKSKAVKGKDWSTAPSQQKFLDEMMKNQKKASVPMYMRDKNK